MNVLMIGAGGREYSIGLALTKDENVEKIYFAPGNGATDTLGENLDISDFSELADFVEANDIVFIPASFMRTTSLFLGKFPANITKGTSFLTRISM